MVSIVLELLSDKNPNIRTLVNAILDYVQIHDDTWKQEIKTKRFLEHNKVYLQVMNEYDKQFPLEQPEDAMDFMYYPDQANPNDYPYDPNQLDQEGFESDENL